MDGLRGLSEISQTERQILYHLYVKSKKYNNPPVLLAGKVLPRAAGGHWLGMESRAWPVLARLSGALPGAQ